MTTYDRLIVRGTHGMSAPERKKVQTALELARLLKFARETAKQRGPR